MPPAARVADPTAHPGVVTGPGVPTVLIAGLPPAGPHTPTPFPKGSVTVLIGGRPALRMGDLSGCGAPILSGAVTVLIGG